MLVALYLILLTVKPFTLSMQVVQNQTELKTNKEADGNDSLIHQVVGHWSHCADGHAGPEECLLVYYGVLLALFS